MRALVVVAAVVSAGLVSAGLTGCPPPNTGDHIAPRVVTVDPAAAVVPVDATFRVTFSEALNPKTVSGDVTAKNLSVVLATRAIVNDAFLSDIKSPPLSATRQNDVVALIVALVSGNAAIAVTPHDPLLPGTAYALVISAGLRDTAGNPLVDAVGLKNNFVYDFTTDAGPPTLTTDVPVPPSLVVPNRKRFTLTFNQPVQNVTSETITIDAVGGSPAASIEAILVDESRTIATVVLADPASGCGRLGLSGSYILRASEGITGDDAQGGPGQALVPFEAPFTTGPACDSSANVVTNVAHVDGEVNATIKFVTTKPATTEVRFGVGGNLDCLGGPCPVVSAPTTTANALHSVVIDGLTVNTDYTFVVSAEDDVGFVATATGTVHTAPLPKIAVNEMLADTAAGHNDDTGEFVELASFEPTVTTDMTGWKLRVTHATSVSNCTLPAASLAPAGFLVIAGNNFDPTLYGAVDAASIVHLSSMCSLTNGAPLLVELLDPTDRPVSSMTAPSSKEGKSVERTAPDAADAVTSFCYSRTDTGPTPGRQNGITVQGCE